MLLAKKLTARTCAQADASAIHLEEDRSRPGLATLQTGTKQCSAGTLTQLHIALHVMDVRQMHLQVGNRKAVALQRCTATSSGDCDTVVHICEWLLVYPCMCQSLFRQMDPGPHFHAADAQRCLMGKAAVQSGGMSASVLQTCKCHAAWKPLVADGRHERRRHLNARPCTAA
jgi:hypothetical protein